MASQILAIYPGQKVWTTDRKGRVHLLLGLFAWFSASVQCEILVEEGKRTNGVAGEGKEEGWLVMGWQCAPGFMHFLGWHPI
jgi:hypothetical protein